MTSHSHMVAAQDSLFTLDVGSSLTVTTVHGVQGGGVLVQNCLLFVCCRCCRCRALDQATIPCLTYASNKALLSQWALNPQAGAAALQLVHVFLAPEPTVTAGRVRELLHRLAY